MKTGRVDKEAIRRQIHWARHHAVHIAKQVHHHAFSTRRRLIVTTVLLLVIPIVFVQLVYPKNRIVPYTTVGTVGIGGMSKEQATSTLDAAYAAAKVPVFFSDSDEVVIRPNLGELGVEVNNATRVAQYEYSLALRFIPYSLFWQHFFVPTGEPEVTRHTATLDAYIAAHFGDTCEFDPVNATIENRNGTLVLQEATRGGSCDPTELRAKLQAVTVKLEPDSVTIQGTSTAPAVSTSTATDEYERIMKLIASGVTLKVEDKTEKLKAETVIPWITYSVQEKSLVLGVEPKMVSDWLFEHYNTRAYPAGTSVVELKDYVEISRTVGKDGRALNSGATIAELTAELQGKQPEAHLVIDVVPPSVHYNHTYSPSDSALSAVIQKYAQSHNGIYGVKMVELSGARRNAGYNENRVFVTASTYKLFVAYSVLLRIERGELTWTSTSYGGQSVSTCFNKMIQVSDNNCAKWLLLAVGYDAVNNDAHAVGATHTTFILGKDITSTPADEAHFLSLLYTGQLPLQPASRNRLIETMKGNVHVSGIPKGIPNATVANKVGFLDGLLHDAAIVYSKKGDYVLIIMTDNASWSNIASLAKAIESAR